MSFKGIFFSITRISSIIGMTTISFTVSIPGVSWVPCISFSVLYHTWIPTVSQIRFRLMISITIIILEPVILWLVTTITSTIIRWSIKVTPRYFAIIAATLRVVPVIPITATMSIPRRTIPSFKMSIMKGFQAYAAVILKWLLFWGSSYTTSKCLVPLPWRNILLAFSINWIWLLQNISTNLHYAA